MNIFPVPLPSRLFQPLANHWLPANGGRVIISECKGVDYLCLEGECRLIHRLPEEKRGQQYGLLFNLLNVVREPVQWQDLPAAVPLDGLITWCETCGVLLPMEIMPDGRDGVRLAAAQVEVLTLYLIYCLWQSIVLPPAHTQDLVERDQKERSRLLALLFRRYVGNKKPEMHSSGYLQISLEMFSPAYLLYAAARECYPAQQLVLLKTFLSDIMAQRFIETTPRPSLLHQPPQLVMVGGSPLTVAYWQLVNLMLQPPDHRRYHVCLCGRRFYGHPNRKWCAQCDRWTAHSRKVRGRCLSRV